MGFLFDSNFFLTPLVPMITIYGKKYNSECIHLQIALIPGLAIHDTVFPQIMYFIQNSENNFYIQTNLDFA